MVEWTRLRLASALRLASVFVLASTLCVAGACGDEPASSNDAKPDASARAGTGGKSEAGKSGSGSPKAGSGGKGGSGADTDAGTSDLDAGDEDAGIPAGDTNGLRDLSVVMTGFAPVVSDLMEFRVVATESSEVDSIALLAALPSAGYTFHFPNSVGVGGHRLEFFADADASGGYTGHAGGQDQSWVEPIPSSGNPATIAFPYSGTFQDLGSSGSGGDFLFTATDLNVDDADNVFELRVTDASSGHVVGLYRGAVAGSPFAFTLSGVLHDGVSYRVDFWADTNDDGNYDAPPTDHAWREMVTGVSSGNTAMLNFTANATYTDVHF